MVINMMLNNGFLSRVLKSKMFLLNCLNICYIILLYLMWSSTNNLIKYLGVLLISVSFLVLITTTVAILFNFKSDKISNQKYIVVLGSKLDKDKPKPTLIRRLDKALELARSTNLDIILCGGMVRDELIPEALAMHNYLISKEFPTSRIILEDQSKTTFENLINLKNLDLKTNCFVVVTSNYHSCRTKIIAKSLALDITCVTTKTKLLSFIKNFYREIFAVIKDFKKVKIKKRYK